MGGGDLFKKTWPLWLVAREYSRFVDLSVVFVREMEQKFSCQGNINPILPSIGERIRQTTVSPGVRCYEKGVMF